LLVDNEEQSTTRNAVHLKLDDWSVSGLRLCWSLHLVVEGDREGGAQEKRGWEMYGSQKRRVGTGIIGYGKWEV